MLKSSGEAGGHLGQGRVLLLSTYIIANSESNSMLGSLLNNDQRSADADTFSVVVGRSRPDVSASFSYFAHPRTDADATLRVTAFAAGRTLMHPSKVAFSPAVRITVMRRCRRLRSTAIKRVQKRGTVSKI